MGSKFDSHETDRHLTDTVSLVPYDDKDSQEPLAKLAHEAARATAALRPADFSAGPRPTEPPVDEAPAFAAADDMADPAPRRRGAGLLSWVVAIGLGVAATLAWQSYGEAARRLVATHAPALAAPLGISAALPPAAVPAAGETTVPVQAAAAGDAGAVATPADAPAAPVAAAAAAPAGSDLSPQIEAMARDVAALREQMAKLATAQEEMTKSLAKLHSDGNPKPVPAPRPAPARRTVTAVPPPPPPPITRAAPRPPAPAVTSAPLSVMPPPPGAAAPEPMRRPPGTLPY
jgi:hypothetical protein